MLRVTNGYNNLSLANFAKTLNTVTGKMDGNTNFPKQQELVTEMILAEKEYLSLAEKATKGSTESKLLRNKKRQQVTDILHNLGNQVTAVCNGNLEMMVSSGLPYNKRNAPAPPLSKPPAPKLSTGLASRQIVCKGVKPKGTTIEFLVAPLPLVEGSWKAYGSNTATCTVTGLVPGQEYLVKYAIMGAKKQRVESDAVSLRPQ